MGLFEDKRGEYFENCKNLQLKFSGPSLTVGRPVVETIPNEEKFGAFCANNAANYFFQNSGVNYLKQTFLNLPTITFLPSNLHSLHPLLTNPAYLELCQDFLIYLQKIFHALCRQLLHIAFLHFIWL